MILLRKIFLEDWLTKLIALGITLALWFGVTGFREPITTRFNNLVLQPRLSNNFEITDSSIPEISIVVTGDKRKIEQIKIENLIVPIDLTEVQAGNQIIQLTPENLKIDLPAGVKVVEVQPNKVAVKIESVEERDINVRAETEGKLAEGFEIYNISVLPQKVRVRAPSSFIKSLEFISTEKINIDERQTDFTAKQIKLNIANPKATVSDAIVDVAFRIGEKRIERLFLIPVQTDGEERKAAVILYGARSVLEKLTTEDLRVEAVRTDTGEYNLKLILPQDSASNIEIKQQPVFKSK